VLDSSIQSVTFTLSATSSASASLTTHWKLNNAEGVFVTHLRPTSGIAVVKGKASAAFNRSQTPVQTEEDEETEAEAEDDSSAQQQMLPVQVSIDFVCVNDGKASPVYVRLSPVPASHEAKA
jgi:hypothetical protein